MLKDKHEISNSNKQRTKHKIISKLMILQH